MSGVASSIRRLIPAFCLLACVKFTRAQTNSVPYFGADTPPDGTRFYSFPGTTFSMTIYAFDDNMNGTANGQIKTSESDFIDVVSTGSGIEAGFNPYPTTSPQWSGAPYRAVMSQVGMWTNRTVIEFSFNDAAADVALFKLIPDPYREVCISLRDGSAADEVWNRRCFRIYVQLAPEFVAGCEDGTLPTQPAGLALFVDTCPRLSMGRHTVIAVGQEFEGNIYFQDYNRDGSEACAECDQVQISVLADPGLPNGASLRHTVGGNADTQSPAEYTNLMAVRYADAAQPPVYNHLFSRQLSFAAAEEQDVTYRVCVEARDVLLGAKLNATASSGLRANATRQCVQLQVVLPETRVLPDPSFAPHESLPLAAPLPDAPLPEYVAGIRCEHRLSLAMFEAKDFEMAVVQTDARAGFEQGVYVPQAEEDPEQPLPPGATVGAVERVAVCEDLNAGCSDGGLRVSHQVVSWTPERGMEGREWTSCLLLRDRRLSPRAGFLRRCLTFRVAKCLLCTRHGDTLLSIASDFHTDWLQLWGANRAIANPFDLRQLVDGLGGTLRLGPLTTLSRDESVVSFSLKFKMSPSRLFMLNPDLDPSASLLPAGSSLCVVSDVCSQPGDVRTMTT